MAQVKKPKRVVKDVSARMKKLQRAYRGGVIRLGYNPSGDWWIVIDCIADAWPVAEWRVQHSYAIGTGNTLEEALRAAEDKKPDIKQAEARMKGRT